MKTPRSKNWNKGRQRSPEDFKRNFQSQLNDNYKVTEGIPDDLQGTSILNRSRSKSRSRSRKSLSKDNRKLHADWEDPAG